MGLAETFKEGRMVVAVLREPRERVWGTLLGLEPAGLALRGVDLQGWEELLALVQRGEGAEAAVSTRFLPMHRLESLYLDQTIAGAASLGAIFLGRTGTDPQVFLEEAP